MPSYVGKFKRADLTIDESIRIEAENIHVTDRFIKILKERVEICKDVKGNSSWHASISYIQESIDRVFQGILATVESER